MHLHITGWLESTATGHACPYSDRPRSYIFHYRKANHFNDCDPVELFERTLAQTVTDAWSYVCMDCTKSHKESTKLVYFRLRNQAPCSWILSQAGLKSYRDSKNHFSTKQIPMEETDVKGHTEDEDFPSPLFGHTCANGTHHPGCPHHW
jgi:hypothetical protein